MHIPTLIACKRDGGELSAREIEQLIAGYTAGTVPDYQMAAFAMAVVFRGMTAAETAALTQAMLASGGRLEHPAGHPPVVDKHSTGGIGDKVSLVLAPLVACSGCWVPMVCGRGLGITGGTVDKLESIPGFNVHPNPEAVGKQLAHIGVVMMGQTERFCPADKKLYALRDVTGTVPSIPLITASILSKKLAESLDRLVLDVKFGSGAFMRTNKEAEELAAGMRAVGSAMGVEVHTLLNRHDQPCGRAVGNALEVAEALECLEGAGPPDLRKLVLDLACRIATVPRAELQRLLDDGRARAKFDDLVAAQGGNPADLPRITALHRAPIRRDMLAHASGTIHKVDAGLIGQAALQLGAGRATANDGVDFAVGFDRLVKTGEAIHAGQPLCRIHARSKADFDIAEALANRAIKIRAHS